MAGNGLRCLKIAGNDWRWREMAGNGLTLLEMAGNDWKGLNMVGNGKTKYITGTGWNRLK